jgi:radical SAM protein with 4Fe4S-binding SPASM domain
MENETIRVNLERKAVLIDDHFQLLPDGTPLPAWIEVSPCEMCNRRCAFCPKADHDRFPNQPLAMPPSLYRKMARELKELDYQGTIVLAGYGEPMLSRSIYDMVDVFSQVARVELVTNGDVLDEDSATRLLSGTRWRSCWPKRGGAAGIDVVLVSMYDGPGQVDYFNQIFHNVGAPEGTYVLRERWQGADQDFGVKLTNRAGTVTAGNQPTVPDCLCHYPAYSMMVDWNGDVLLCAQDWNRRVKAGNLASQTVLEVWDSPTLRKYRQGLAHGRKGLTPCSGCNAAGTLHGAKHAEAWQRYYARGAS